MSNYLVTIGAGYAELLRREGEVFRTLAYRNTGVWYLRSYIRKTSQRRTSKRKITDEEAAMILFGCKEQA